MTNYNDDDLDLIKQYLRKTSDTKNAELILSLTEAYNDLNMWLRSKGVDPDHLPFASDDDDIETIKEIEARGGAGFYTENAWMQTFNDTDRQEADTAPTNTHLALYYQRRNAFYNARFNPKIGGDGIEFKRGSTVDECPPEQDVCDDYP